MKVARYVSRRVTCLAFNERERKRDEMRTRAAAPRLQILPRMIRCAIWTDGLEQKMRGKIFATRLVGVSVIVRVAVHRLRLRS